MKLVRNMGIFFLFLLLFLVRGSLDAYFISWLKEPSFNTSLEVSYQNLKEEYDHLAQAYQLDGSFLEQQFFSKAIYRNPFAFYDSVFLLKGEEDGILLHGAVMDENGFLGVIEEVEEHKSMVRLLTSRDAVTSVKVRDTYGIMKTNDRQECWIENLTKDVFLEENDEVWTSGLTDVVGNIFVGTVEEIQTDELGLIQRVKVKLATNFHDISYVMILQKGVES